MTTIQVPAYAAPAVQRLLNAIILHIPHWHPITKIPPIDTDRTAIHYFKISAPLLLVGYDQDDGDREYHCGYYSHQIAEWEWDDKHALDPFVPTHWCDLPTPPEVTNDV